MKELIVYIQNTPIEHKDNEEEKWFIVFCEKLKNALQFRFGEIITLTTSRDEFFNRLNHEKIKGIHLPLVDAQFVQNSEAVVLYNNTKTQLLHQYKGKAFSLSVLIELFPYNHVQFQPFFKFYFSLGEKLNLLNSSEIASEKTDVHFKFLVNKIDVFLNKISSSIQNSRTVYIGAGSSDLNSTQKQLYNFLLNNRIPVSEPLDYSLAEEESLVQQISQKASNSWLTIHACSTGFLDLVKKNGIETLQTIFELELKQTARIREKQKIIEDNSPLRRIIWIPVKPSISTFEGRLIERILSTNELVRDADILFCSFEELKQIIISYSKSELNIESDNHFVNIKEKNVSELIKLDENPVLILYDEGYKEISRRFKDTLLNKNISTYFIEDFADEVNSINNIMETLLDRSSGVILLSSNWNSNWYKYTINLVIKSRLKRSDNFNFVYTVSDQIEQLPSEYENFSRLMRVRDLIENPELLQL